MLKQTIADSKPLQDRLNKTGSALLKLVGEEGQEKVQDIMDQDNQRFDTIRNGVRERTIDIEEAIQQTSEVRWADVVNACCSKIACSHL